MTPADVSMLLVVLGGTSVLTGWMARRTGDAARDAWLILATGAGLLGAAGGVWLL